MKKHKLILTFTCITSVIFSQSIGINLSYIDSSYKPQNDFYNFCNAKWVKSTQIPPSDSKWGSFNEINERNLSNLKVILDEASKNTIAKPGSEAQKLRDFYITAMDSAKADKQGINPIKPQLALIDAVKNTNDVIKLCAVFKKMGIGNFINFDIDADFKNSNRNVFFLAQGGFTLPDRDFYFLPQFEPIRKAYLTHMTRMFELLNFYPESAEVYAKKAFEIEKALALKSMNAEEQRDIQKMYNPYSLKKLKEITPNISWDIYFLSQGLKNPDTITITQPDFYIELNSILKNTPLNDIKTYLKWKLINRAAPHLSFAVESENFNFFGKTLSGAKQMKPRWKRSQHFTNIYIGEILGKFYVEKYFNDAAKEKVKNMVENLIAAYRERLETRDWMSAETKKQANLKLDKLIKKFGFPDVWKDYSTLSIKTDSYWQNVLRTNEYEYKRTLNKVGKPVDKMVWGMTPPTVNAYYNPTTNEIAFPAGIMQPPFFDAQADDAFNYGVMGAIIGHELTHGFDDQGSQFDSDGNLKMWWTEQDFKNFTQKTNLVVEQFNAYVVIDTIRINGSLTQGENIADLGGLTMSYYAYKKSLNGKKSPIMGGFTGEQRFFIAWAQGWKILFRDEALKQQLATDPHAPGKYRAFVPLTNLKEFYEAFNLKEGDTHYRPPHKRVEIW